MEEYAFSGINELKSFVIPASITSMVSNIFKSNLGGLSKVTIYVSSNIIPSSWDSNWNPDNYDVYCNCDKKIADENLSYRVLRNGITFLSIQ